MNGAPHILELGHEADGELVMRLHRAVVALGGSMTLATHDVGGMEELISYEIILPEGELEVVAETSMGLRLSGDEELVVRLAAALKTA